MGIDGSGTAQDLLVHLEELALASLWRETDRLDAALHAPEPQQAEIAGARMSLLDALELWERAHAAATRSEQMERWERAVRDQNAMAREKKEPAHGHLE